MKKNRNYIMAGAYYRLMKEMLAMSCEAITNSLGLKKTEAHKLFDVYDEWVHLETKIGFERMASNDNYGDGLIDLFYGGVTTCITDTDREICGKIKEILQRLIDTIDRSDHGNRN